MLPEIESAMKAVDAINEELFDITNDEEIQLWCESNGSRVIINFCSIRIWDSENDDREYLGEDIDEYEDLENYIRKEFNKIKTKLSTIGEI